MFEAMELEVTRKCTCGACGETINKSDRRIQVVMPWQIRGVNYHKECLENFVSEVKTEERTSIGSSFNCTNHTLTIYTTNPIIFQYFLRYGFSKCLIETKDGQRIGLRARIENAESVGTTIKTAFENDCEVFINGHKCKTLANYDARTKEVCMR